jgi:hypothetical protein
MDHYSVPLFLLCRDLPASMWDQMGVNVGQSLWYLDLYNLVNRAI